MKRLSTSKQLHLPALAIVLLSVAFVSQGTASASTTAASNVSATMSAQRCDGNRIMHEATNRYRMFYDRPYAAAQVMAAATKQYRMFYDLPYAAAQRMAAATDLHCAGHP